MRGFVILRLSRDRLFGSESIEIVGKSHIKTSNSRSGKPEWLFDTHFDNALLFFVVLVINPHGGHEVFWQRVSVADAAQVFEAVAAVGMRA